MQWSGNQLAWQRGGKRALARMNRHIVGRTHQIAEHDRNCVLTQAVDAGMPTKPKTHDHESSRTTGNEPIEAIDPGGTRSTKPGKRNLDKPDNQEAKMRQRVTSGDRNTWREPRGPNPQSD
jgi:hypothetical protein